MISKSHCSQDSQDSHKIARIFTICGRILNLGWIQLEYILKITKPKIENHSFGYDSIFEIWMCEGLVPWRGVRRTICLKVLHYFVRSVSWYWNVLYSDINLGAHAHANVGEA